MGPRPGLKLPKWVHGFVDRHGTARYYFRRPGYKRVALPSLPHSTQFLDAYQAALAGTPREIGVTHSSPGTLAAAVAGYFSSVAFAELAKATQVSRRRILERFRVEHGSKGIATLERTHVQKLLDAKATRPGGAINFFTALRALMKHAVAVGLRSDDPTVGVRGPKFRSDGFYTWTEQDIAAFEARHPIGSRARPALALLLYTAQRRGDVVRMGRQHVRDGLIHVRQSKTGQTLAIPLHPELQAVLNATPVENMTFLVTRSGKPFHPDSFGHWFREQCQEAGLSSRATAHGLRKAACRRLAEHGASANVIAAISGHRTLREVARYTAAADQERLARRGIEVLTVNKNWQTGQ